MPCNWVLRLNCAMGMAEEPRVHATDGLALGEKINRASDDPFVEPGLGWAGPGDGRSVWVKCTDVGA
jgi:hypothetical protein